MNGSITLRWRCLLFVCVLSAFDSAKAQGRLRLERLDAPGKQRVFRLDRYYHFNTLDTVYFQKVVSYNDSTLLLQHEVRTGDTTVVYPGGFFPEHYMTQSLYRPEFMQLPVAQVTAIDMPRVTGRTTIIEPFAWIGFAGVLAGAVTLPFAIFGENGDNMGAWAIGTGVSVGVLFTAAWSDKKIKAHEAEMRWRLVRKH